MMKITNKRVYAALSVFLVVFWGGMIALAIRLSPNERVYDCSMAEFHPDYTPAVRKACRERMGVKL